jgi:anti-anti-sigma factor
VLVFDTLPGLFIGIAMSLLLLIYRASHPHIAVLGKVPGTTGQYGDLERHPDNQQLPGIVILRVESGMFFANADAVRQSVRAHAATTGTRVVVLDAETVPYIDVTAVRMLTEVAESLEREGVRLLVSRQIGQVRDVVRHVATDKTPEGVYPTVQAAVQAAQQPQDSTQHRRTGRRSRYWLSMAVPSSNSTRLGNITATTSPRPTPTAANCSAAASTRVATSAYVSSTWPSRIQTRSTVAAG